MFRLVLADALWLRLQTLTRIFTVDYQYQSFMITVGMSFGGLLAGAALEWAFRRIAKRPYDLTNPFTSRDVMPLDTQGSGLVHISKAGEEMDSTEEKDEALKK